MRLFEGFASAHGTHGEPHQEPGSLKWQIKRTASTLREPVTLALWEQHLSGTRPLGVIPIREDSSTSWGSIDHDVYDEDLTRVIQDVERRKFPLVPCRSKSGGLHLFLFAQVPTPTEVFLAALREMAAALGMGKDEIFPKQTRVLPERGDMGSWMVMPYYGDTFDGKLQEQVGLRRTGAELTIEEFLRAAEAAKVSPERLQELATTKRPQAGGKKPGINNEPGPFGDGPPCLQHLVTAKLLADGRKRALFHMAIYYKRVAGEIGWHDALEQANRDYLEPPLPAAEVLGIIRSMEKKEYHYTCKAEPMASHCDSSLCRKRKYGVGGDHAVPSISSLRKMEADPTVWFVEVSDKTLVMGTDDLIYYPKFMRACAEESLMFDVVAQKDWSRYLHELQENIVPMPAPPDVERGARFFELIEEFCTNRARGETRDDLLSGRPWLSDVDEVEIDGVKVDPRYWFRMQDLQNFLGRQGVKDMPRSKIRTLIEKLGGGHHPRGGFNLKGKFVNAWFVPAEVLALTPRLDPPRAREQVI